VSKITIIPAIDIIDGKCVRLHQGDYASKKIYYQNPIDAACQFEAHGIKRLHLVDLDGAKAGKIVNTKVLEGIANATKLQIDFGGGIYTDDEIKTAFSCGAAQITAGSVVVKKERLFLKWLEEYGSEKIILGADTRDKKIMISGWSEGSSFEIFEYIARYRAKGIQYIISTDIAKDGALQGPSLDLYKDIIEQDNQKKLANINLIELPIKLIASGGVTTIDDIVDLQKIGVDGVIIGKALYEGSIQLTELEEFIY
jgi:phosphoribosylformimino-5-aminoimidazole carboxamide ribotide isomerase